ncbi:MAG TPA: vWA domain-containing protein [Pyrinomonadaceae bacterium]|nr:vWA domain-containing protein [Pyrinomonadaceae bacterium]
MKKLSLRLAAALLTFTLGITASALLINKTRATHGPAPRPPIAAEPNTLEMVFVLDTTGSMGGLLEGAKQKIWSIVNEVQQQPAKPSVRIGLVAYRDRGDAYVTQVLPLTNDLDRVYTTLMDFRAEGGGDTPENVRRALADAVARAGWSQGKPDRVARIIFLVGDAPPHDDYRDEPDVLTTTQLAVERGMMVNTIQCGQLPQTGPVWEQIARRGEGQYFRIAQDGGVEAAVATPFDAKLSELASRLGGTYMAYGGGPGSTGTTYRAAAAARQEAAEKSITASAPAAATADRAANKALNKDAYVGDLLQAIENGTLTLDAVPADDLPDDLQKLSKEERAKVVGTRLDERRKLRAEITTLSRQRDEFIAAERGKKTGKAQTGFDAAVATALKAQLARRGIK